MILPWSDARPEGWIDRIWRAPLALISTPYAVGAAVHRWLYASGALRRRRLPCVVVSVGSLVAGGAGKTPLAAWLASGLQRRGLRVAIASRGYRGRTREAVLVVSDGRRLLASGREAGDESLILVAHAPSVPVLVGRDRGVVGLHAVAAFDIDVLVLDDGTQHHRLARDFELMTFDAGFGLGNARVLPRGPLREASRNLRHADAICQLDGPLSEVSEKVVTARAATVRRVHFRRRVVGVRDLEGRVTVPGSCLEGVRVGLISGIGNPAAFRRTAEAAGADVVCERIFPDHHRYRACDLRDLGRDAPIWVTTEKDAVKILPGWAGSTDLRVLVLEIESDDGAGLLDEVASRVARSPRPGANR